MISLVREGEVDAALERPERRVDSREADDGIEDDVRPGALEEIGQVSADHLQWRVYVVQRRRPGGGCAQLELGVRLDDLDRLAADRPRRPEQRDPLHPVSVGSYECPKETTRKYAAGAAKRSASTRSSTPPCPPRRP